MFSVTKLDRFTCSQLLSLKPEVESSRAPRTVKQAWPREWASDMEQVKRGAKGRVWGRVVWLGGGGGGRRRLWRRSTPQQAFNQYPATTLIINNNINTLQLTLICNRGTPLHGARANPLYKRRHAHPHPLMGRIRHGPQIGGYCLPLLVLLMFICMSKFCWM